MDKRIDYSALTERIDKAELARSTEETSRLAGDGGFSRAGWITVMVMVSILVFMLTAFFVGLAAIVIMGEVHWEAFSWGGGILVGGSIILIGFLYRRSLIGLYDTAIEGFTNSMRYRLRRFASENGLRFFVTGDDPHWPGMMFGRGRKVIRREHLRPIESDAFEYGNMARVDGSNRGARSYTEGAYLAIKLENSLPNIALVSRRRNPFVSDSALQSLVKSQVLSLEGDFDKHFTLYCPEGYERDALYIFTPDLMALFIDHSSRFDAEIIDNRMFVYLGKQLDLRHPIVHKRFLSIVDNVAAKALSQTERYRDSRQETFRAHGVAPAGRRLATTISVSGVVLAIVLVGFPILGLTMGAQQ